MFDNSTILLLPKDDGTDNVKRTNLNFVWYATFSSLPLHTIRETEFATIETLCSRIGHPAFDDVDLIDSFPAILHEGKVFTNTASFVTTLQESALEVMLGELYESLQTKELMLKDGSRVTTNNKIIDVQGGAQMSEPVFGYNCEDVKKLRVWNIENKKFVLVDAEIFVQGKGDVCDED